MRAFLHRRFGSDGDRPCRDLRDAAPGWERFLDIAIHCHELYLAGATTVFIERPTMIRRNDRGELHSEDAPAIEYRDGWGYWFLNNMEVSERVVTQPHGLGVEGVLLEPTSLSNGS